MSKRIGIAAAIWAVGILLSRVVGLVREATFGRIVGGGLDADLYLSAFRLPDFLNYLLAAGALSIVFIPQFRRYLDEGREDEGWRAFSEIATFLAVVLGVANVFLWGLVPVINAWWFPGFSPTALAELDGMTRVVLVAQVFHVLGALLSAALQARDRHALPAMAPLVYTGGIILGGLVGGLGWPESGAWGFVWGVLAGSVLGPFGLPLLGCLRMGLRYRPRLVWSDDLKHYLARSLPIMLAFSIVVVDDWMLSGQGSTLGEGAVATTLYAKTIMRVPMGIFGLALGAAAFPTLARLVVRGQPGEAFQTLWRSTRTMLVLAFGAQVGLTVAGPEVAEVIYGSRLLPGQHAAIGVALGVFCLGLWAWSAQSVLARGFYALDRTWIPSLLGTASLVVALPLYVLFAHGLGWGTAGLALASSVGISVYGVSLVLALRRAYPGERDGFGAFLLRAVPPTLLGIGAGLALRWGLDVRGLLGGSGVLGALVQGTVYGLVGGGVYLAAAWLFGVRELGRVWALVRRRLPGGSPTS
jgi:putative peptidoglycan lipid II flippase